MSLKVVDTKKAPGAVGPYSQGMSTGNMVFTSGQLPIIPETGEIILDDIKKATRLSLENVKAVLEEAGTSLEKVIKVTIYLKDMNDFPEVNKVYEEYFNSHKPARSCVEVARLPKDGTVEIEAIAIL